jgi:hypothetical protein
MMPTSQPKQLPRIFQLDLSQEQLMMTTSLFCLLQAMLLEDTERVTSFTVDLVDYFASSPTAVDEFNSIHQRLHSITASLAEDVL